MPKLSSKYVCQQCGWESAAWMGRCPGCETWNSLVETFTKVSRRGKGSEGPKEEAVLQRLSEIKTSSTNRISTGLLEFDRVLGGGMVPGSVTLLAGDPGIGKSTLLLQVAANTGRAGEMGDRPAKRDSVETVDRRKRFNRFDRNEVVNRVSDQPIVLYVSGEESPGQIKIRAERLGLKVKESTNLLFLNETNVDEVINKISQISQISLVIIDSIQTMWTEDLTGTAGSVGQVRECAARLLHFAKSHDVPIFFVGHVNKEGAIAGPMVLSHLVDTVLYFEGERFQSLRLLRCIKNRFGPTDEVGVFSMEETGLVEIENPSKLFLSERQQKVPGSVITALMEGSRSILVEVQALVVPTQLAIPRRVGSGVDLNRLQLLVAVLSRRAGLPLSNFDIFVNIVGGIKVSEPSCDLAICLAIASAWADKPVDIKVCALGEVGLLGEVRSIGQLDKRIKEAKRLGFTTPVTPKEIKDLREAIRLVVK